MKDMYPMSLNPKTHVLVSRQWAMAPKKGPPISFGSFALKDERIIGNPLYTHTILRTIQISEKTNHEKNHLFSPKICKT